MMKQFILLIVVFCAFSTDAKPSKTNARIDGVTSFLIERAKENYLFIYEKKLKDNEDVQCFLPNINKTLSLSGRGGLKQLLNSNALWKEKIVKDMEVLTVRSLAYTLEKQANISDQVININSALITALQKLSIHYQGNDTRLDMLPIDTTQELKDVVNGFYDPINRITKAMYVFKQYESTNNQRDSICAAPLWDVSDFKEAIAGLTNIEQNLKQWEDHWNKHKDDLALSQAGWTNICKMANTNNPSQCQSEQSTKKELIGLFKLTNSKSYNILNSIVYAGKHFTKIADENNAVMPLVIDALDKIQRDGILLPESFQKFSQYVRFFGMLADATTSDEVKGILESFTLPPVSFYLKREEGSHFMISSYLGFAHNTNKDDEFDKANSGFFAPIGFEYTLDKKLFGSSYDGSVSIMASPFDFGYPVNLKLNGIEKDIEFDEIVAPSLTVAYGFKEYPIIIGLGVQKGAKIGESESTENRVLLFIAFDMPLFNLFNM